MVTVLTLRYQTVIPIPIPIPNLSGVSFFKITSNYLWLRSNYPIFMFFVTIESSFNIDWLWFFPIWKLEIFCEILIIVYNKLINKCLLHRISTGKKTTCTLFNYLSYSVEKNNRPHFGTIQFGRKHSRARCQNCAVRSRAFILHHANASCYVQRISRVNK